MGSFVQRSESTSKSTCPIGCTEDQREYFSDADRIQDAEGRHWILTFTVEGTESEAIAAREACLNTQCGTSAGRRGTSHSTLHTQLACKCKMSKPSQAYVVHDSGTGGTKAKAASSATCSKRYLESLRNSVAGADSKTEAGGLEQHGIQRHNVE